ncbi:MAG TPA: 4-hydroxythreonine-4-phosphate dehydrogenase PdxA, partial [Flavitalea sp.]|nr:4-hydroxythreonine-4-phosphate dehydrogenase PdxA [Flavitalea sp.]
KYPDPAIPRFIVLLSLSIFRENMHHKPVIGISTGDINGIGPELIIKTFSDARMLEMCTPVVFGSNKVINFYRRTASEANINYQIIRDPSKATPKQLNILNCWEEEINITPGQLNETGGRYAVKSLVMAAQALKENRIQGLVTAPIHKNNTQSVEFNFTGHTPYLKSLFEVNDVVMLMVADNFRVGLVTEHVPISEIARFITRDNILSKLSLINHSLIRDFGIDKPKIAVLGLNPHAGDEGLIGREEEDIIKPAIKEAKNNYVVAGPFSADAFFARSHHLRFDAVLAMYHDQGLIPFKSLSEAEGVNFTAGLPGVRTSPDHGTAFDIAGKNIADHSSFLASIYKCLDIIEKRTFYRENHKNPLKKITSVILANAVDESIEENGETEK